MLADRGRATAARRSTSARARPSEARRAALRDAASTARPTPTSSRAARARRSSPAIRGSPTGAATRSSRCAASASRPAGSTTRARSCSSGRARSPRACSRTASPTAARRPSTTPSTPRSGTWSRCTSCLAAPRRRVPAARAADASRRRRRDPRRLRRAARATASALDDDGLLAAGEPGVQLTWMDAKVGDWVVTPRIGKPVEVQALWLNALPLARRSQRAVGRTSRTRPRRVRATLLERGARLPLRRRRRRPPTGHVDATFRPNQILAVGGLPLRALDGRARAPRSSTPSRRGCWTPLGLRSLAPGEPGYVAALRGRRPRARRRLSPGHGLAVAPRARSSRRGCASAAARPRRRRGARALPRAAARAPRRGRPRPRLRDRRRRAAPHAARLPVPGVVGRRAPAPRSGRAGLDQRGAPPLAPVGKAAGVPTPRSLSLGRALRARRSRLGSCS